MEQKYLEALKIAVNEEKIGCVLLQRKLSIGYELAYDILEQMEKDGFVSALNKETFKRKVLISKEEYEKLFSEA